MPVYHVQSLSLGAGNAFFQKELRALLRTKKKTDALIATDRKSAAWKVEVAAATKRRTTVTNRWLSEALLRGIRPK